ncbi:patatin-like phospholipase family protein [Nitratifractor sp.]
MKSKPAISLVLGSGGARGYAHIGVIEVLERHGITIASISGASMGALVGGLHAAGALEEYTRWVLTLDALDVASLLDFSFAAGGIIEGEKVFGRLAEMIGDRKIEDLPIPFTAVATDIIRQKEVWFQRGDLLEAIRASIAIPSVFTPVRKGEMVLVDGGVLNPLPVAPAQADMTDLIVAVNLYGEHEGEPVQPRRESLRRRERIEAAVRDLFRRNETKGRLSMFDVLDKTFDTMQDVFTRYRLAGYPPDVTIDIPMNVCNTFDFHKAEEVIEAGRIAAEGALAESPLRELIHSVRKGGHHG